MAAAILLVTIVSTSGCATTVPKRPTFTAERPHYPESPDAPRIVFLATLEEAVGDTHAPTTLERFLFGDQRSTSSSITTPYGIAAWKGQVFVCDTQQDCVHCFDIPARRHMRLGGDDAGRTSKPVDVAVGEDGTRYVADAGRNAVLVYDTANRFVRVIGQHTAESPFKPVSVSVAADRLYVANGAAPGIVVFSLPGGDYQSAIGGPGDGPGQFLKPAGVTVDAAGNLYVVDAILARVQVFKPDGQLMRTFGRPGQTAGCMARPRRVAVDPNGVSYVADAMFNQVHLFDDQGRILMLFGGSGDKPGSTNVPADVCLDTSMLAYFEPWIPEDFAAEYLLFVTNQLDSAKVNVYAFGEVR